MSGYWSPQLITLLQPLEAFLVEGNQLGQRLTHRLGFVVEVVVWPAYDDHQLLFLEAARPMISQPSP